MSRHRSNDIISGAIHAVGVGLSIAALVLMVVFAAEYGTARHVVGASIFGSGLIMLYAASSVYHFWSENHPAKQFLQLLDHAMIYVLIAATYTPICLVILQGGWGWSLFGVNWGLAVFAIVGRFTKLPIPNATYYILYLVMGWSVGIAIIPLLDSISQLGFFWLLLGGVLYTFGVVFFALEKKFLHIKWFGMHELFHVFVLAGSFSHFFLILKYI